MLENNHRFYLKAAGADSDLENRAKNFALLVLSDRVQFCYFPSTIAAALVILASLGEKQDTPRQRVIEVILYLCIYPQCIIQIGIFKYNRKFKILQEQLNLSSIQIIMESTLIKLIFIQCFENW